eukprot:6451121-Amphidinium_carterae.1
MALFPNERGMVASKGSVVLTFEVIAEKLGKDLTDDVGRSRFSGHSLRVGGAQYLARLGMPMHLIHLQARWASSVIERYVAEVPLEHLTSTFNWLHSAKAG